MHKSKTPYSPNELHEVRTLARIHLKVELTNFTVIRDTLGIDQAGKQKKLLVNQIKRNTDLINTNVKAVYSRNYLKAA